jgi:alpha-D-ribose 1-methylphosphonate 5-triphosphate synthase subunit PhnI
VGYAAARGGHRAILAAERLVRAGVDGGTSDRLGIDQILERLPAAVDRVMGEAGLWAPELAARAIRQAQGDVIEAAHLLRAHRSTLPQLGRAAETSCDELEILRRIVPAYRQAPGQQLLGRTVDYVGRLLRTADDEAPGGPEGHDERDGRDPGPELGATDGTGSPGEPEARRPRRLLDLLRDQDLVVDRRRRDDPDPVDVLREPVRPGVARSARLSVMARAETGALVNLWYRNILGPDGHIHEITLGEVRHGRLPVRVEHPATGQPVTVGTVRVTEVEAIEDLDGPEEPRDRFDVGYGLCLGHNERKAIAMANLDIAVERDRGRSFLEQSVLMTADGLEASGFLEHLKLPHYVTFRSMVERKLALRARNAAPPSGGPPPTRGQTPHAAPAGAGVVASAEARP